ncbi:hypothetical protein EDE04_6862 [Streptomyces sp. 2132.2]|nr:hypothetical protein EDE04_6862 [Streptomyces sp. 2132.2]
MVIPAWQASNWTSMGAAGAAGSNEHTLTRFRATEILIPEPHDGM